MERKKTNAIWKRENRSNEISKPAFPLRLGFNVWFHLQDRLYFNFFLIKSDIFILNLHAVEVRIQIKF